MTGGGSEVNSWGASVGEGRQDDLFALPHPHRRFALQYLRTVDSSVSVGEVTTELLTWETERPVADRPGGDGDTTEVELAHCHLPKVDEAGFVRYDATQQTVALADRTGEVRTCLQTGIG